MSQNNDFSFDLDDILAEFSSNETPAAKPSTPVVKAPVETVVEKPVEEAPPKPRPAPGSFEEFLEKQPEYLPRQGQNRKPASAYQRQKAQQGTEPATYAPLGSSSQPETRRSQPERQHSQTGSRHSGTQPHTRRPGAADRSPETQSRRRAANAQPSSRAQRRDSVRAAKPHPATAAILESPLMRVIYPVLALIALLSLCWILVNVHPDSGTATTGAASTRLDLVSRLDTYANNAASEALGELAYIPKVYTIPESDVVAPEPDSTKFGSTTDPNEVQALIDSPTAVALLAGQELSWSPDLNFVAGSSIQYYCDDTILVITWKEDIAGKCVTCAEVKVAHGSQVRRKIAGDTYSTGIRYYATDMAREANAVVAINGDFYDFRQIGVTVYQRTLYRFAPDKLDSCHFTSSGDMLFSYAGELSSEEYTKQFIADNDVVFTLSFGPILVDNGQLVETSSYPIGEINSTYSRSAIGQLGELHYLLMTVNYADGYTVAANMSQIGQFIYSKNCQKAYALDGGQTSLIIMDGETVNHVDYGYERTMSDIIYFATAIPSKEAGQ